MSTLLYEALTSRREVSDPATPVALTARKDGAVTSSPASKLLDSVVALVPVEVLAAHAALLALVSKSSDPALAGPTVVTITDEPWATRFWWPLLASAVLLYVIPHALKHGMDGWDVVRATIPAAAFAAWTMLQPGTLFDAVNDWSHLKQGAIAVFVALAVLLLSRIASDKANEKYPKPNQKA